MEPISLAIMAAAAGKVLESLLGESANKLVASIVGGVIGNRADWIVCRATGSSWNFFQNLRTSDPALNHDLSARPAKRTLLATLELIRQAELQIELGAAGTRLLTAGDGAKLAAVRRAVDADLRDIDDVLPTAVPDAYLFVIDPDLAPAARLSRLRDTLRANLAEDFARWLPGGDVPAVVDTLLDSGWLIDTKVHRGVPRDWFSLIAIAFVEKLKTTPRVAAIFEARLLARLAAAEPAASSIASFAGFTANLDAITAPLQRIEDALGLRSIATSGRSAGTSKTSRRPSGPQRVQGGRQSRTTAVVDVVGAAVPCSGDRRGDRQRHARRLSSARHSGGVRPSRRRRGSVRCGGVVVACASGW